MPFFPLPSGSQSQCVDLQYPGLGPMTMALVPMQSGHPVSAGFQGKDLMEPMGSHENKRLLVMMLVMRQFTVYMYMYVYIYMYMYIYVYIYMYIYI